MRTISGDGLFTAYTTEPNWSKAHNILLPNFGDRAMQGYHPMMLDVAEQMMLKWERLNPDDEIDVVHDMTALTLDTIGICGFGYRFNSFYREDNHPFVDAMVDALEISMSQRGLPFEEIFTRPRQARLAGDAQYLNKVVDQIVHDRKEARAAQGDEPQKKDMLDYMLAGVDRKSGERLDDTNIRYQIITFLIAGHETTSGLLSFATYFLLSNPDVLAQGVRRSRPRARHRPVGQADDEAGQRADVRPAGSQRVAAAVADRARVRAAAVQGRGDRRQVRAQGALASGRCCCRRCTAIPRCGASARRSSTRRTSRRSASARARSTRTSRSATASARASGGSSRCRKRRWSSA